MGNVIRWSTWRIPCKNFTLRQAVLIELKYETLWSFSGISTENLSFHGRSNSWLILLGRIKSVFVVAIRNVDWFCGIEFKIEIRIRWHASVSPSQSSTISKIIVWSRDVKGTGFCVNGILVSVKKISRKENVFDFWPLFPIRRISS